MQSISGPPILRLLPSLRTQKGSPHPVERDVNRKALLDIAPDREALRIDGKSTDDIRHALKIETSIKSCMRCEDSGASHWVYWSRQHTDSWTVQESTLPISVVVAGSSDTSDDGNNKENVCDVPPAPGDDDTTRIRTTCRKAGHQMSSGPIFNTNCKLVSPMSLGPTHVLVVFDTLPANRSPCVYLECAINDIVFLLNCPNLVNPLTLPRRLASKLPRVAMRVSHLETFSDLVVYLHNKDQAELFRKMLPGWILDLLHPLPYNPTLTPDVPTRSTYRTLQLKSSKIFGLGKRKRSWFYTRSSIHDGQSVACSSASSFASPVSSSALRTVNTIAQTIAEATADDPHPDSTFVELVSSVVHLNALKDNLDCIGYHGHDIWQELDTTCEVLIRAINLKARAAGQMVNEG